jgi:hypothetical protein
MQKIWYAFFIVSIFCLDTTTTSAAAAAASLIDDLPEIRQDTDVHTLSKTYCRMLWERLNKPDILGYGSVDSDIFRAKFDTTVSEMGIVLERISKREPIMIGDRIILCKDPIDEELLAFASYFDAAAYRKLTLALNSMKELGKHKGGSDLDNETIAHVNEIFVYSWEKVKEDPELRLTALLIGLEDAAPTCIQGYSVRMLCAIHPPKQIAITGATASGTMAPAPITTRAPALITTTAQRDEN